MTPVAPPRAPGWAPLLMRRNIAYEKLGITDRAAIRALPPISSQLRMASARLRKRNLPASPYYYLKCSEAPEARKIVDLYYSLPKNQRDLIPIEGYCLAAGISTQLILELVTRTCATVSRQTSALIAAASHPAVVDKTVEMALTDDGIEDRQTLHKAVGFLPTPKGAQIAVNVAANAAAHANAAAQTLIVAAPPPEATIRRLSDRFNEARLVAGASPIIAVEPVAALPEAVEAAAAAPPMARFGQAPSRFTVPSRAPVTREVDAAAEAEFSEEEEDE